MAKCPDCEKKIMWDWCNDLYVYEDGEPLPQSGERKELDWLVGDYLYTTCKCGSWISIMIINKQGASPISHPTMKDIDWEDSEHTYSG